MMRGILLRMKDCEIVNIVGSMVFMWESLRFTLGDIFEKSLSRCLR